MKLYGLLIIVLTLCLSGVTNGQSVTITPRKVDYERKNPIDAYKKRFTVIYPKIKASSPSLSQRIEETISYKNVSELNIDEELNEEQWLAEATYKVDYDKNGILIVTLSVSGSGAYPSTSSNTVAVDLRTGNRVTPDDIFTNLDGLAIICKKAQREEIRRAKVESRKRYPNLFRFSSELFDDADFQVKDLNEFTISDRGVTFLYDYAFPHVALALQPPGQFFFSWQRLKPFIRRDGLLARFIR
jgi:hypothetical protein